MPECFISLKKLACQQTHFPGSRRLRWLNMIDGVSKGWQTHRPAAFLASMTQREEYNWAAMFRLWHRATIHFANTDNKKHPHVPLEGDELIESQCYFSHYIQHILNTSQNVVAKWTILVPQSVSCYLSVFKSKSVTKKRVWGEFESSLYSLSSCQSQGVQAIKIGFIFHDFLQCSVLPHSNKKQPSFNRPSSFHGIFSIPFQNPQKLKR